MRTWKEQKQAEAQFLNIMRKAWLDDVRATGITLHGAAKVAEMNPSNLQKMAADYGVTFKARIVTPDILNGAIGLGVTQRALANALGVTPNAISNACRRFGITWARKANPLEEMKADAAAASERMNAIGNE